MVKSELAKPSSKLGVRETQKGTKLMEALSGYIKPRAQACKTAVKSAALTACHGAPQLSSRRTPSATTTLMLRMQEPRPRLARRSNKVGSKKEKCYMWGRKKWWSKRRTSKGRSKSRWTQKEAKPR